MVSRLQQSLFRLRRRGSLLPQSPNLLVVSRLQQSLFRLRRWGARLQQSLFRPLQGVVRLHLRLRHSPHLYLLSHRLAALRPRVGIPLPPQQELQQG